MPGTAAGGRRVERRRSGPGNEAGRRDRRSPIAGAQACGAYGPGYARRRSFPRVTALPSAAAGGTASRNVCDRLMPLEMTPAWLNAGGSCEEGAGGGSICCAVQQAGSRAAPSGRHSMSTRFERASPTPACTDSAIEELGHPRACLLRGSLNWHASTRRLRAARDSPFRKRLRGVRRRPAAAECFVQVDGRPDAVQAYLR